MAKVIKIEPKHKAELCDSETGKSCITEKVVDITDECSGIEKDERYILLYTRAKRGRIVQITNPYKDEVYMGVHIHFFIDELDTQMQAAPRDDTFGVWAEKLGLKKLALRNLIEKYAPTT